MTVLLTDSPSYWPTNRLTQVRSYSITRSLTKWLSAWKTVLLTDYLTDWLSYWLTILLTDCLTDWLSYWLTILLTDYLTDWLSYWLTILLTDYLTDWLTDWLTDYLTDWFTARLSWWLTISATYLLKNRQILLAKWLTDWMTIDEPTDWWTNERNRWTDRPMDGLTTDGLTDWRTWTDGVTGEWMTEIYYDWPVMSDYLNRPDSLKWPISWLIYWPTDWLVGWLAQLLREGIILCLLQFS